MSALPLRAALILSLTEQLFYLRSRGIPELDARRLVVRGFFAELVHEIRVLEIEERIMAAIERELEQTMVAEVAP